jgi:hypothetical protein
LLLRFSPQILVWWCEIMITMLRRGMIGAARHCRRFADSIKNAPTAASFPSGQPSRERPPSPIVYAEEEALPDIKTKLDTGVDASGETVNRKTGERGGPRGPEPTRYGDWEKSGRCYDF